MKQFFKNNYPLLILFVLVSVLFATNYQPGTILSGWDNLHPEFDFALNIKRSIFAVWQEYQGLGLLGGMAHSTDLLRQLLLLALSVIFPTDSLRYIWVFLTLFIGSAGAYFLIKHLLHPKSDTQNLHLATPNETNEEHQKTKNSRPNKVFVISLLGSLFYLFNLATIQMFFVPFESFIGFYAFLPWLIYASILYLENRDKRHLILLIVTLLLSTPAWYLQTLFIVFMIALSILALSFFLKTKSRKSITRLSKLYIIIFLVNSFWLLPAIYFTATNSKVNLNSKINQMVTETIFLQNKEFGTLPDFMLLKGFMFKGVDPNSEGKITYMLKPWIDHLNNPLVLLSGYLLFAVVFVGFLKAVRSKNPALQGFSWLFIFSLIALAIDTFPFSFINTILRENIPVLNQIFRFPFTKFSSLTSLVFAVLFAIGVQTIITRLELGIRKHELWSLRKTIASLIPYSLFLILLLFIFPVFRGDLFYQKERIKIPQEYKDLFTFFKNEDPNTRIANFPQSNFWGWSFYKPQTGVSKNNRLNESYGGSGFLWYGIKQPILDRAFDVWSQTGENYYFEVSHALYSKDPKQLEKVLNKYQITWVLIDKNIFDPSSQKALFVPELEALLSDIPGAKIEAKFGKIDVYKITLKDNPKNFVFLENKLPVINSYNWNNIDQAYTDHGNYVSTNSQLPTAKSYFYPYRSLFSLKTQKEKEFTVTEEPATISLSTTLPANAGKSLVIPSFTKKEKIVPVQLRTIRTSTGAPGLEARVLLPQIIIGERVVQKSTGPIYQVQLPLPETSDKFPLTLSINGATFSPISNIDQDIGVAFFVFNSTNVLTVLDSSQKTISEVVFGSDTFSNYQNTEQTITLDNKTEQSITVRFPKVDANFISFKPSLKDADKVQNCDNFRGKSYSSKIDGNKALTLSATDAIACTAFFAQNIPHDQSYGIFLKSTHREGQGLRFWVENTDQQYAPLDVYLPKDKKQTTSTFILPPMEEFGSSYAFHFFNTSIGRTKTVNEINSFAVYPIFYNYLKSVRIQSEEIKSREPVSTSNLVVKHPNESLYVVSQLPKAKSQEPTTLVLSQSFNNGWHAYSVTNDNWFTRTFPFIFGKEVKNHVMVNNWANGWQIENWKLEIGNSSTIVLVYLPQYLQYAGFGALLLTIVFIIFSANIRLRKKKNYE